MTAQTTFERLSDQQTRSLLSEKASKNQKLSKSLVLICAYNEEKTLPFLLRTLAGADVLVVDDGSIDRTCDIVSMQGVAVVTHDERLGKAASLADGISYALQNMYDVVVEIGADAIPEPKALHRILESLEDESVGAASCKQIPVGHPTLAFHIDELIWAILAEGKNLQMARHGSCHLGAVMFGFRPQLVDSVEGSVNDDEEVGISIASKGYKIIFNEEAVVHFDGSSCIGHILERRKRMYYGHMKYVETTAPSMELSISVIAVARAVIKNPKRLAFAVPTLMLDFYARLMAWRDTKNPHNSRKYSRWVTTYAKDNSLVIRNSSAQ